MGMKTIHKIYWVQAFLLIAALSQPVGAAPKNELTIALNAEFETLNPIVNSMMAAVYVLDATLRPVVALTPDGKPTPILIQKIPSLENKLAKLTGMAPDQGMKVQLDFLPEARWSDGKALTCEDMKASWIIGKSPLVTAPQRDEFQNIEEINVDSKNPKKCEVVFKQAKWNFYLNFPRPVPAHIELKVFNEHQEKAQDYERNSQFIKNPTLLGLYNGPYRVAEIRPGSHVTLVVNENFFGTAPFFKKIIFKFILNTATMESNLRSGGVDLISSSGFTFDQALSFEKKVRAEGLPFEVLFEPGVIYSHVDFNLDHPDLIDGRVRQALAYGFNRDEMVKAFFEGRQEAALHFSSRLDSWFTENPKEIKIYSYDRKKAMDLLEQAGWKLGTDGWRTRSGKKLSFTLVGAADNKLNEMLQVYLQDGWKKIGVEVKIKNYPARVLFSEILKKRNFELALYSWVSSPDGNQKNMLHSQMIPSEAKSWAGSNRPGWKNKEVDRILEQVETQFDAGKRKKLMKRVLKAYTEELPALPLYYRSNSSVIPQGLKKYRISGHVYSEYLQVETWKF